ncbi:MAG: hypothetical protein LCH96_10915 [Actinobacteria bacterium]|nr:hypothetical protein [Actinomycetota bacterium]
MTADQTIGGPAPRHAVEEQPPAPLPAPADEPTPIPPAPAPIATLDAPPDAVIGVPDDPRTGEPRVPWLVVAAAVLCYLAVANLAGALLTVYWNAVPKENFANASWLMGQFVTEPGSLGRVLLAVAVTVITLLIAVPVAITGYYGWAGYRWTRVGGLICAALSFGALTLNVWARPAIPLTLLAAGLLWTRPAGRYFLAWQARRHPVQTFAPPTTNVYYGPLPRYR